MLQFYWFLSRWNPANKLRITLVTLQKSSEDFFQRFLCHSVGNFYSTKNLALSHEFEDNWMVFTLTQFKIDWVFVSECRCTLLSPGRMSAAPAALCNFLLLTLTSVQLDQVQGDVFNPKNLTAPSQHSKRPTSSSNQTNIYRDNDCGEEKRGEAERAFRECQWADLAQKY